MRPEWQAHLDELLAEYRRRRDGLKDLQEAVAGMSATATAADGMVTVTVDPQGRLVGLDLSPRVHRALSPPRLARAVLQAAGEAAARVEEQVRGAVRAAPGGAGSDLSALLPEHPGDVHALTARYGFGGRHGM